MVDLRVVEITVVRQATWWDDLKAIFAYLRTVKPVEHRVDNTEKPTFCKVCKQKHGLGERN